MKIIKGLYLITVMLLASVAVKAQESPIILGIKGGLNLSSLSDNINDPKPKIGYQAGITLDCRVTPDVYILTGLELANKGAKEKITSDDGDKVEVKHNPLYLQIPVHAGYKMVVGESSRIVLHAGPYLAYGIGGKYKVEPKTNNADTFSMDYFGDTGFAKRFDYGFGLGVSAEVSKFVFNIGFDVGLANIVNDVVITDENGNAINDGSSRKMKNQNSYLTLGYKF